MHFLLGYIQRYIALEDIVLDQETGTTVDRSNSKMLLEAKRKLNDMRKDENRTETNIVSKTSLSEEGNPYKSKNVSAGMSSEEQIAAKQNGGHGEQSSNQSITAEAGISKEHIDGNPSGELANSTNQSTTTVAETSEQQLAGDSVENSTNQSTAVGVEPSEEQLAAKPTGDSVE